MITTFSFVSSSPDLSSVSGKGRLLTLRRDEDDEEEEDEIEEEEDVEGAEEEDLTSDAIEAANAAILSEIAILINLV